MAFQKNLLTAQMQAKNLLSLREESTIDSSKTSSMMTAGAKGDDDRCGVDA